MTVTHTFSPDHQIQRCVAPSLGPGLWPRSIAELYGVSLGLDGDGQCIGIVALGGGYKQSDVDAALADQRLPTNTVFPYSVNKFQNTFGNNEEADIEVSMDVQIVAGLLPRARIVVYSAPSSQEDFIAAVAAAAHDNVHNPSILSISWGFPESQWSSSNIQDMQTALQDARIKNMTVLAASGDLLASCGLATPGGHVLFPASSPDVLCCGGTQVVLTADQSAIAEESVWNDNNGVVGTGGGLSNHFSVPPYQQAIHLPARMNGDPRPPGRGIPDVAALAAGNPGFRIVIDGIQQAKGGTSAATPLWAALIALANAKRGSPVGFVNPCFYSNPHLCQPILSGDNAGYEANGEWNACTGFGVPNGERTITGLSTLT